MNGVKNMGNANAQLPDLTAAQAARALGLSVATVKRRSDDGTIPFRQLGPRGRRRYRASELIRLGCTRAEIERALGIEKCESPSTSARRPPSRSSRSCAGCTRA